MEATTATTSPITSRRRRRPGTTITAAAAVLACGLLLASTTPTSSAAAAAQEAITIQAVPDSTQLSTKGSQAGCDHYRNGYLGLALCVNFYDDHVGGK
jgi:hypothetical protein